jgi:hypothetical protein
MELDLSGHRSLLLSLVIFLLLLTLGWLGHAYLPSGDKFLTHTEWQFLKASLAYRKELSHLQAAAETLVDLLNDRPDPVRAQLVAQSVQRLASQGQPALSYPRGKLFEAAQAVSDWAVGAIEREVAGRALDAAVQALFPGDSPFPTPLSSGRSEQPPGGAR